VDALGGEPGVRSARYAGEGATDAARNGKLLAALEGVPPGERGARFRCAVALVFPDGSEADCEGACEGVIALAPSGANGFGYDPLFVVAGASGAPAGGGDGNDGSDGSDGSDSGGGNQAAPRTMAELSPEEKNAVSHRGKATRAALAEIAAYARARASALP
jgi:XTP/dITP diphosphohydrolase